MERCPNCGTPGRQGAKFCTTCGNRFDDGDDEVWSGAAVAATEAEESTADELLDSWPSAPASSDMHLSGWEQKAAPRDMDDAEAMAPTANDSASFWPDASPDPWLAANVAIADDPERSEPDSAAEPVVVEDEVMLGIENTASHNDVPDAVARAHHLLDELRDLVGSMGGGSPIDLSGVISDLEVATTPPGAMAPEDVAELREALLTARERPRDVDTIVDLTKRIEAMVALVIAYDRTIAAIERSLDVLRNEGARASE